MSQRKTERGKLKRSTNFLKKKVSKSLVPLAVMFNHEIRLFMSSEEANESRHNAECVIAQQKRKTNIAKLKIQFYFCKKKHSRPLKSNNIRFKNSVCTHALSFLHYVNFYQKDK